MKRRPSSSRAARFVTSISCITADALTQETRMPRSCNCRRVAGSAAGENTGCFVRSISVSRPRSSIEAYPLPAAAVRIRAQLHAGAPSVEKASGNRDEPPPAPAALLDTGAPVVPATRDAHPAAASALMAAMNSRRVVICRVSEVAALELVHGMVHRAGGECHVGERR